MTANELSPIRLVVFDWAGTTVDFGCFAPVAPFVEAFARCGVTVTTEQARAPMGLGKRDHVRALLSLPDVAAQWRAARGREWTEDDVGEVFSRHFVPLQMGAVGRHARLIPGVLGCVARLREAGVKVATTTGYFRAAARAVCAAAREQGYAPDADLCAEDVPAGRPAPWMVFRHMEALGVYPPRCVVKVGDTVPDVEEGRNAGAWSVGVTATGSGVGLTEQQWAALAPAARKSRTAAAGAKLLAAGAHAVADSVADLPPLLYAIARRLRAGENP